MEITLLDTPEISPALIGHGTANKTIYTLDVDNYEPRIKELTYPLLRAYADKIGADFTIITQRLRPQWPVTIEKFQVADLARRRGDVWSLFIDSDTLINPEFFDPTNHMDLDTVAHNGKDMAGVRWKYDKYFRRDGRHIGSCTWFVIASHLCVEDLWRLPDMTPEEAYSRIHITIGEHVSGQCKAEHLIDDYTLSRNIARFGLKFTTITDICGNLGWKHDGRAISPFLWHIYNTPVDRKVYSMLGVLCTPNTHPAFPFGIPGEMVQGNNQPLFKTSKASCFGPPGSIIPPVGPGWGLMDPGEGMAFLKRWKMQ